MTTAHPHGSAGPAGAHPVGRPGGPQPAGTVHPAVRAATPGWVPWGATALAWVAAAATALLLAGVGRVLDSGVPSGRTTTGLALLALVAAGTAAATPVFTDRVTAGTERRLRAAAASRVLQLGVTGTAGRSGELLSATTELPERVAGYRAGFVGPIIGALTTPLLVLAVMALTVDPVTAGWLALLVLLVPVLIGGFQRLVRPVGGAYRRAQGQLTAGFLEAIGALGTLVHARAAERAGAELARRGEQVRRSSLRLLAGNQLLILVVDAAFSLTVVVAAAGIATVRVSHSALTLGEGVAIVLMTTLVIGPVDVVGQFFYVGVAGRAAQARLGAHLGGAPTAPTRPPAPAGGDPGAAPSVGVDLPVGAPSVDPSLASSVPPDAPGSLMLDDVTAGWPGGAPVLRGLSLRVEPGERVALVGPSGVGKSTVAALIQAHLDPRAGRVLVDGLDTRAADPRAIRAGLAVVEQRTHLFLGTVADNLRAADPAADDDRLRAAMDVAGLRDEVELATPVGEGGRLLSGGQAQRVAIARAWLRDAPILLLDEPTSQVDLAGEAAILAALDRLAVGRTVLTIAHRPAAVRGADRVVVLGAPR